MKLGIIAAVSSNGVIGREGKLPWNLPEDLKHFKSLTMGSPIIMGRKTYESIGRPLPGRQNIVLTSRDDISGVNVVDSLDSAISLARDSQSDLAYVIGGESLYMTSMDRADFMELTEVHRAVEGDTYFPDVDWDLWREVERENKPGYSFVSYVRK